MKSQALDMATYIAHDQIVHDMEASERDALGERPEQESGLDRLRGMNPVTLVTPTVRRLAAKLSRDQ